MTESIEERALRIAAETNVSQPDGCGSCDEWTIEFARRLWAEQPICACGDSFTDEAMCINCIASTPSLHGEQGEPVKYGCHCDIEETKTRQPAECVFDNGEICDCFYAACLQKEGKGKRDCEYYRPIAPPPAVPANGATIVRTGEHNGGPYDMSGGVDDGATTQNAAGQESNGRGNGRACEADQSPPDPVPAAPGTDRLREVEAALRGVMDLLKGKIRGEEWWAWERINKDAIARALAPERTESGPCPLGENCPDAHKYGGIHPAPASPLLPVSRVMKCAQHGGYGFSSDCVVCNASRPSDLAEAWNESMKHDYPSPLLPGLERAAEICVNPDIYTWIDCHIAIDAEISRLKGEGSGS